MYQHGPGSSLGHVSEEKITLNIYLSFTLCLTILSFKSYKIWKWPIQKLPPNYTFFVQYLLSALLVKWINKMLKPPCSYFYVIVVTVMMYNYDNTFSLTIFAPVKLLTFPIIIFIFRGTGGGLGHSTYI